MEHSWFARSSVHNGAVPDPPSPPLPSSHPILSRSPQDRSSRPRVASYSSIYASHSRFQENDMTSSSFISAPLNRPPTAKHAIKLPSPSHISAPSAAFTPLSTSIPPSTSTASSTFYVPLNRPSTPNHPIKLHRPVPNPHPVALPLKVLNPRLWYEFHVGCIPRFP